MSIVPVKRSEEHLLITKNGLLKFAKLSVILALAFISNAGVARADLISVPFQEGFVGSIGSSNREATNVLRFSTLGISSSVVQQNSSTNVFESPTGNDIPVTLVLNSGIDTLRIPGNISWKIKQGNNLQVFGFTPSGSAAGFQNYTINYGSGSTLTLSSTSNYGLVRPPHTIASLGITDGSTQSGSNDPINVDELNAYLAEIRASRPYGPITVDNQTVSLSGSPTATPILTGDACLVTSVTDPTTTSVETISVVVDGKIYSSVPYTVDPSPTLTCQSASGFTVESVTWSLQTTTGIAAGIFDVAATITSTKPYFNQISDSSINELTVEGADPLLSLTKTLPIVSALSDGADVGDQLQYTITAENKGAVAVTIVDVTDTLTTTASGVSSAVASPGVLSAQSCSGGDGSNNATFSVGEICTWTYTYSLSATDVLADTIENLATLEYEVGGTSFFLQSSADGNETVGTPSAGNVFTGTVIQSPILQREITATKVVSSITDTDSDGRASHGDVVNFTITLVNSGEIDYNSVSLSSDVLTLGISGNGSALSLTSGPTTTDNVSDSTLSVGETWTYTASYTLLQDDIDAGGISNIAVFSATPANSATAETLRTSEAGNTVTGSAAGSVTAVSFTASPSIEGVKTVAITTDTGASGLSVGDTLTYTIAIENTGNVTLTGVGVQSDTLSRGTGGTLSAVSGFSASSFTTSTSPATLAPGASLSYTATYVVTQADIDAGGLSNTATVVGTPPSGSANNVTDVTDDGDDQDGNTSNDATENTVTASAAIEGVKTSSLTDADNSGGLSAGDTLTYTVTATNTGNVTLSGVAVQSDTLTQMDTTSSANSLSVFTAGGSTTLAPGGSVSFTATYVVAQADIDAGGLSNTATVVGTPPSGSANNVTDVTDDGDDQDGNTSNDATENTVTASAAIEGVKTSSLTDADNSGGLSAGDTLTYTVTATNTGNVTLSGVAVQSDTLTQMDTTSSANSLSVFTAGGSTTLAPGGSVSFTATYVVAQADIDAGGLSNTATVVGTPPSGSANNVTDVTDDGDDQDGNTSNDATENTVTASAAIEGVKTSSLTDADNSGGLSAGDTLTYTVTATNTGNVTLTSVGVSSDTLSRGTTSQVEVAKFTGTDFDLAAGADTTLLPGDAATFTVTYTVTQADVDAGRLSNTATVIGTTPTSGTVIDITDDGVTGTGDTGQDPTISLLQPFARDDRSFGNEIGSQVNVSVLTNDSFAGASSPVVILIDQDGNATSEVNVTTEGVWTVETNNVVRFTPEPTFVGDPTPVGYKIRSSNVPNSTAAFVYIDYLGVKAPDELVAADDELVGQDPSEPVTISPLDNDANGDVGELVPATLRLLDANNNPVTELQVAGEGTWTVNVNRGTVTFTPVSGFAGSNVSAKYYVENTSGLPQTASMKILFIDPRGVVYDSETLSPLAGVTLQFADASGTPLPASCLADGQQPQTTSVDGRYRFDLSVDCTDLAGKVFQILVTDTPGYQLEPAIDGKQVGPLDPGTPASGTYEVVSYDNAPSVSQTRRYYMSFKLGVNSRQIVNNHIPLSSLVSLIEDDLRQVLRDDLAATMTQQSRQMSGYAASALQRLKDESPRTCAAQINEVLQAAPILFETGSAVILEPSSKTLDRVARLLSDCEGSTFEVGGHTDNVADEAYNLDLSLSRAASVVAALRARGVPRDVLSARGYGESQPVADNSTDTGRQLNRRVEFVAKGRLVGQDHCAYASSSEKRLDAELGNDGAKIDGDFRTETRDCARDGWTIFEGSVSYLSTDRGTAQGMANLSYRTERFRNQDHLAGRFIGIYATNNDVTGLATGTIKGFGFNAGLYGARRYDSGLYLDYYLGGAAGRHNFSLGFSRTTGEVMADGHYTYVAAFTGAAVSGETMLGDYKLSPRAGFEGAWSPGGEAEYEASRGSIEQIGALSTGEIAGLRVFGELSFNDLLLNRPEALSFTPMFFCDRPMGENRSECGFGLSLALTREDEETGMGYGIEVMGERTASRETIGLQLNYKQPLFGGELSGTSSVGRNGEMTVGANYVLDF